jgi:hypothetical protein
MIPPHERGFDAYVADVLQHVVDKSDDKDALISWLTGQLEEWEREAERSEPFFPFPASDAIGWTRRPSTASPPDSSPSAPTFAAPGLFRSCFVLGTSLARCQKTPSPYRMSANRH